MGLQPRPQQNPERTRHKLTRAEAEVVRLLARGLQGKEISVELNISLGTVKTHLQSAYRKLGVHNQARAVARLLSDVEGNEEAAAE